MFTTKIRIYFFDGDPAGISFYGNIFKYAHIAYEEFMWKLFPDRNVFLDRDYVLPIFKANANFLKPMLIGEKIKIKLFVSQLKDFSFEVSYSFYNKKNELTAKVETVHVSVLKKNFKKIRIPVELKTKLEKHLK
ncbi:MAG: thioesterase family protein [Bacteroidetes bacterium]|nr:thioesterase family protein [Bacteroidota bacterium]